MNEMVLKYYNLDDVLYTKIAWKDFIKAYKLLKKVNNMTQVSELNFWDTLIVISKDNISLVFIVFCYAGILEDDEEITIYSEHPEEFGSAYGKVRINKQDLSITIEPFDFVPEVPWYYYIFGKTK